MELHRRPLSGVPEILEPEENFEVLTRLVDHFERHVANPRPLEATPEVAADARKTSRGTVGLRLFPTRIVAKQKMSQNKSREIVATVLNDLEADGPYANESLAREMRLVHDPDAGPD